MSDARGSPERTRTTFFPVLAIVGCLLLVYLVMLGPASVWIHSRFAPDWQIRFVNTLYWPVFLLAMRSRWCMTILLWYLSLWGL